MNIRKTTNLWIISYLLVLILPISINLVSYFSVEKIIFAQTQKYNNKMLDSKLESIDSITNNMSDIAAKLVNDKNIMEFADYSLPFTVQQRYDMDKYIEYSLKNIEYSDMLDAYIYFPKSDSVLSTNGLKSPRDYFVINFSYTAERYARWREYLNERKNGEYHLFDAGMQKVLLYTYVLTNSVFDENSPCIIVSADIRDIVESLGDDTENYTSVYTDENVPLILNDDEGLQRIIDDFMTDKTSDIREIKYNGKKLVLTSKKSAKSQWSCAYIINKNEYARSIMKSRLINLIGIGLSILFGSILIYFSVRRNHKPLKNLVEQLSKASERVKDDPDDYKYLGTLIHSAITEKNKFENIVSMQRRALRDSVLAKLLKEYESEQNMQQLIHSFEISFPYECFFAVVIYIDDVSQLFFEENESYEEDFKQAGFILINVLEELLGKYFSAYVFKNDGLICCIVNSNSYDENAEKLLTESIMEASGFIQKNFNFKFVSAVSERVYGMENIKDAYNQALDIMEYKFVVEDEPILRIQDMESGVNDYYYPVQKEQLIIAAIKAGDFDAALSALNTVFDRNFGNGYISGSLSRCLMFDILCTIIKAVKEMNSADDSDFLESMNLYERITQCQSVYKMRSELTEVLREICANISGGIRKHGLTIQKVMDYIERFYDDANLSVSAIAHECGMAPNYLSMIFRKNTGKGVLEYISEVRISKAKELIMTTNETLENIAKSVGYSNSHTFTRIFRKYEGMTPGMFRRNSYDYLDGNEKDDK